MNIQSGKSRQNETRSLNNNQSVQSNYEGTFQRVDNRTETVAQLRLQEIADSSQTIKQFHTIQRMADRFVAPIQRKEENLKRNNTGLPDNLKTGIENLSGYSLDDVKVHYNSDKPKQVQAHAYAQGTDIHLAAGQEKHLAHEAWHVVQQKQGRVKETRAINRVAINDDHALEAEADVMGAKALQRVHDKDTGCCCGNCTSDRVERPVQMKAVIQRARFLSAEQAQTIEELVGTTISNLDNDRDTDDPAYNNLVTAYNNFEDGSNAEDVLNELLDITDNSMNDHVQTLHDTIEEILETNSTSIRADNYPSGYNQAANNARDHFQNGRLIAHTNNWTCPGNGTNRAPHATHVDDITIDHVYPCASHWNTIGYNSTRGVRNTWYNNTNNHHYMCRSCNSSLGSGGVRYRLDKGRNYHS